ncbi:hypothetical protein [Pseudomonas sp. NCCP-436]|uniref:hypothetical protein n=1 Tax=Pseudomonas sp. NCCP-436 TaxID=2842481 RepID=UPI001C7F6E58|nr:hypothetical protein [Pseudomonas sp. NCCP-436]GIZ11099.1 hypothetical protein NCCP436_05150 [Pseudomonas sp. NCCP-436]
MELTREVLDCMKALRRRLRQELDLEIHLNQPDAIICLFAGSQQCLDEETRRLGLRLAELSNLSPRPDTQAQPTEEPPSAQPTTVIRIYRGQRIYA